MTLSLCANGVPGLIFERGAVSHLAAHCQAFGSTFLIVKDKNIASSHVMFEQMREAGLDISFDTTESAWDGVLSVGSARAIDQAKQLSGTKPHICVPTTVGIGASMNGVIFNGTRLPQEENSTQNLPTLVIADADFIDDMDRHDFAMRAIGTLMMLTDAYISRRATVLSDALAWSGLEKFAQGFLPGVEGDAEGREQVFYASLMAGLGSGLAGFGLSHNLAAIIEQQTDLRYAQISATLSAEITDLQINQLADCLPDDPATDKYAMIGELLAARPFDVREEAYASLVGTLRRWVARLDLPKLEMSRQDLNAILKDVLDQSDRSVLAPIIQFDDLGRAIERRSLFVA